jgi:hypothetical protein
MRVEGGKQQQSSNTEIHEQQSSMVPHARVISGWVSLTWQRVSSASSPWQSRAWRRRSCCCQEYAARVEMGSRNRGAAKYQRDDLNPRKATAIEICNFEDPRPRRPSIPVGHSSQWASV